MTTENLHWPTPPFYALAEERPAGMQGQECAVDLLGGGVVLGEIARFEPGDALIALKTSNSAPLTQIPIDKVRMVKLTHPLLLPDSAAVEDVGGAGTQGVEDKDFRVRFTDGSEFSGKTRGFVKEATGLFLFPVEGAAGATQSCFIPALALSDFSIGPLLGETLAKSNVVPPDTLAAALDSQAALRAEPLGEYLHRNAIVSRAELTRALDEQKRRPNVRIGDVLKEVHLISQQQLDQALTTQKANRSRSLGKILLEIGVVTPQQIQQALAMKLGFPFVNVREFKLDIEALKLTQGSYAKQHQMLPLIRTEQSLVVAVENPLAIEFTRELRFATGLSIVPVMAEVDELRSRIITEYTEPTDIGGAFNWDAADLGTTDRAWTLEER